MKTMIPLAVLAALTPLASTPAEVSRNVHTVTFRDLDVASAKGRAALDRRIRHAAAEVCGTASDLDLAGQNDLRKCRTQTADAALAQVETQLAARSRAIQVAAAD